MVGAASGASAARHCRLKSGFGYAEAMTTSSGSPAWFTVFCRDRAKPATAPKR
jgi:hypothetical protein